MSFSCAIAHLSSTLCYLDSTTCVEPGSTGLLKLVQGDNSDVNGYRCEVLSQPNHLDYQKVEVEVLGIEIYVHRSSILFLSSPDVSVVLNFQDRSVKAPAQSTQELGMDQILTHTPVPDPKQAIFYGSHCEEHKGFLHQQSLLLVDLLGKHHQSVLSNMELFTWSLSHNKEGEDLEDMESVVTASKLQERLLFFWKLLSLHVSRLRDDIGKQVLNFNDPHFHLEILLGENPEVVDTNMDTVQADTKLQHLSNLSKVLFLAGLHLNIQAALLSRMKASLMGLVRIMDVEGEEIQGFSPADVEPMMDSLLSSLANSHAKHKTAMLEEMD